MAALLPCIFSCVMLCALLWKCLPTPMVCVCASQSFGLITRSELVYLPPTT
jgi:hypothetical protein